MKILLISDTHCKIELIEAVVEKERPVAVLHAGDFGFYGRSSIKFLPTSDLRSKIAHSDLASKGFNMAREEMETIILSNGLITGFENYLKGGKRFSIPVYAILGNHDDMKVAKKAGNDVYNFNLVFSSELHLSKDVRLFGIPGSVVLDDLFWKSNRKVEGGRGNPLVTWSYIKDLIRNAEKKSCRKLILLTHFDSYETPLLRLVAWRLRAMYVVSGHLHRAGVVVRHDTSTEYDSLMQIYESLEKKCPVDDVAILKPEPISKVVCHINMPSAEKGYCCIEI